MSVYTSPILTESLEAFCEELTRFSHFSPENFESFDVKRGLRNSDGSGVMAGLTKVCNVSGYYLSDGEKIPREGKLRFRGIDVYDLVDGCQRENRFGYEETAWLLLFGSLPTKSQLDHFTKLLAECRELPEDFIEDMIMKAPSPNIMNKLARSVLALYSYDENPDELTLQNVLRQSIQLIAQLPSIMAYAYQVKRRHYYHKSMYLHPIKPEHTTAQTVINSIRSDKTFTDEEAKLLDLCLILHAEHGGGNNSTFATRVLTSGLTDTYSAIAAGVGALKGSRHGGANIKVSEMLNFMHNDISDITNENQVADYLVKLINKEAGDRSGLIYGMGHAIYTLSDPRAVIIKKNAKEFAEKNGFEDEFRLLELIETLTPEVFAKVKGDTKKMCANIDLYSGLVYKMLKIPEDLYTPLFTVARVAGWSAHRIEELLTGGRIIRPAYKSLISSKDYIPLENRTDVSDVGDIHTNNI